ncbi:MAG: serine protease [Marinilabiliales bacterium]|nr:MAG: serine protease [Marinilabiliales bacterium]
MQQMGCELSAEEIYSINKTSLKDGFLAMSMEEEVPTPDLSVTFLVRIEDVSDQINKVLNNKMTEPERQKAAKLEGEKIAINAALGNHYSAKVKNFYGGNKYYLLVYEKFTDVRMVGAPPSSIGKFGADTDNWMWPRHTGDFSLFRVYASKDNKPADYSPENVPYKPKHHLPISLKGVQKDDFAMILGYPGGTDRYMTSIEIDELINIANANRIYVRGIRQEILLEDMLADDAVRIKYASKYSGSSNKWKNSIGMNKALKQLKIIDEKKAIEKEFTEWVNRNKKLTKKYGEALSLIEKSVNERADITNARQFIYETMRRSMEIFDIAYDASDLYNALANESSGLKNEIDDFKVVAEKFYKDYNAPTDRKVVPVMFKIFAKNIDSKFYPDVYTEIESNYNDDYKKYVDYVFENSLFADEEKLNKFLENPSKEILEKDPAFIAAQSINNKYDELDLKLDAINADFDKGHRMYIAGILEKNEGKAMYTDANFTMRLTYGTVLDYYPRDAVHYDYITTLKGVMEKEDPDNWEFVVHDKLKELYQTKDYGRYALETGEMPVAFISTNDITGGNSGSPVINGKGELIGTAFDGNWEAMSGDIVFENELQRCINVDARYTLFIIDKFAGATRLIEEMTIVE